MSGFRVMRYGALMFGLAMLAALVTAVPLSQPLTASAQGYTTCPNGQTYPSSYGYQYCSTTTTTTYGNCVNPFNGQACSAAGYTCPGGQVVSNASSCSTTTYQYCGSTYLGSGQYCCPNGIPIPSGTTCTSTGTGFSVTYQAGWNIIAAPPGTTLAGVSGPLYTYRQNDSAYEVIPVGSRLRSGWGYWAYFPTSTTVTLATASRPSVRVSLPPGQFVMVGNPGNGVATVSGANVGLFTYTPNGGYQQTTSLNPGQGAWAISSSGGTITISSSGGTLPPPPPF